MKSLLCAIFVILCPVLDASGASGAWELQKDEEGIRVYTREVKGSDFKAYRGVTTVEASPEELAALVNDISSSPEWVATCTKGVLLERVSKRETYTYTINHAPWPLNDRDAVVRNCFVRDKTTQRVTIKMRGVPGYIPERADLVRVKRLKGCWRFTPLSNGETEVIYEVHSEPGGNIPSWLANSVVVSQPFQTLLNMKKMVGSAAHPEVQ